MNNQKMSNGRVAWRQVVAIGGTVLAASLILMRAGAAQPMAGKSYSNFYYFAGKGQAATPECGLVAGNGVLYGTSYAGGASDGGTVYQLTPPASTGGSWTQTVLYSFQYGYNIPDTPTAGLVRDSRGVLYSTTYNGGLNNNGTVYSLAPPATPGGAWTYTDLHDFRSDPHDGAHPHGALFFGPNGTLYGTTINGGKYKKGAVFQLTPPSSSGGKWTESLIYSFLDTPDGRYPWSSLVMDVQGNLYGTTQHGGAAGYGTVYELTPGTGGQWTESVLYSFVDRPSDGGYPYYNGVTIAANGTLYGATAWGGAHNMGTIYQLTPPSATGGNWTETVLYSFTGANGDAEPLAAPVIGSDGALYGTTYGGNTHGYGTVYQLNPPAAPGAPWTETVLHAFTGYPSDGAGSLSGLIEIAPRTFAGTTWAGGTGGGTAFQVTVGQ